ncbi:unnamed protein product, partial [Onchocerca flexuosa]|uniref:Uncharacterized protein n=1 Tax=Onchocerca flexuosa TaxID=387005 RepID=A0A183HHN6_9BILA
ETRRNQRFTDGSDNLSPINISTNTRVSFDQPTIPTGSIHSSAFSRLAAIGDSDPQKTSTLRHRRTSLPVTPNAFAASRAVVSLNIQYH